MLTLVWNDHQSLLPLPFYSSCSVSVHVKFHSIAPELQYNHVLTPMTLNYIMYV